MPHDLDMEGGIMRKGLVQRVEVGIEEGQVYESEVDGIKSREYWQASVEAGVKSGMVREEGPVTGPATVATGIILSENGKE